MRRDVVVVVGGGAMGSAAAWQLALRGHEVTLLERFAPGHAMGASHGRTRNFNVAYTDPTYQAMVQESAASWRGLEEASGSTLLDLVGQVVHGAGVGADEDAELRALGVQATMLGAAAAQERWTGFRFDTRVLHLPRAGRVRADAALVALQQQAVEHGAEVLHESPAAHVVVRDDGLVEVVTERTTYVATAAVVTAGAWTDHLVGQQVALPRLTVTQEQPAHFAVANTEAEWPSFMHLPLEGDPRYRDFRSLVYGMLTPGEGIKAGWHGVGPVTDPDRRSFAPEPEQLAALQAYARDWLPGVDPDDCTPISCTYTSTVGEDFVLDRRGPLVVGAGFSGHGFKFVPAIGRILADLVEGKPAPPMFRFDRP